MKRIALCLVPVVVLCSAMYARQRQTPQKHKPDLELSGATLQLGMTETQVEEKLSGTRIKKAGNTWAVGDAEGLVQFTNGQLSFASRSWTTDKNDIPQALFGAVSSLNKEGYSRCSVTAEIEREPKTAWERVNIDCGEKGVRVIKMTADDGKTDNSVMEHLGKLRENISQK